MEALLARVAELERKLKSLAAASSAASDLQPGAAMRPLLSSSDDSQPFSSLGTILCSLAFPAFLCTAVLFVWPAQKSMIGSLV